MAPKVGIGVFITSPTGQIILGKRKGSVGSGTWAVPGGHLEDGESFETCAAREVHEETGLNVSGMRFLTATNSIMVEEGKHYVTVFMGCQIPGDGEPRVMEPDKCEGWEWVSWEDAKRYSHSQTHPEARRLFLPILDLIKQRVGFDPVAEYTRSR